MADPKTQSGLSTPSKSQLPQKPGAAPKPAPLASDIKNKRVITRLLAFFATRD